MITPEPSTSVPEGQGSHSVTLAPIRPGRAWLFALAGAVAAGLGAFAIGEAFPPSYKPPVNMVNFMGSPVDRPTLEGLQGAERKNAMLTFGILGGGLALALGLAGGMVRRSAHSALIGGVVGLVLGVGAGVGATAGLARVYHAQSRRDKIAVENDLTIPLLIHAGLWAAIGAAAGVAFAIGAGAGRRTLSVVVSALIGGALGAAVYEVVAALISPEGRTYQPVASAWPPRLLAAMICPIAAAALATFALVSVARPARKDVPPAGELAG